MERLVSTAEAAEILGLSVQGIHYRIRKNQLKSEKIEGKTFVYVSETKTPTNKNIRTPLNQNTQIESNLELIIDSKDEQIKLLKKSIKWMRKQYISEISRLEKNQKRIIDVFNSEIKLLQSAFNEMRAIYKPQIMQKVEVKEENKQKDELKEKYLSIKEFFSRFRNIGRSDIEIKNIIQTAIKNEDSRFIYKKDEKKLMILNEDFSDLY